MGNIYCNRVEEELSTQLDMDDYKCPECGCRTFELEEVRYMVVDMEELTSHETEPKLKEMICHNPECMFELKLAL